MGTRATLMYMYSNMYTVNLKIFMYKKFCNKNFCVKNLCKKILLPDPSTKLFIQQNFFNEQGIIVHANRFI